MPWGYPKGADGLVQNGHPGCICLHVCMFMLFVFTYVYLVMLRFRFVVLQTETSQTLLQRRYG